MKCEIHNAHWALWAQVCREVAHIGYPRATPFYTPPRRSSGPPGMLKTDLDDEIAELIAQGVKLATNAEQIALTEFFGAYPGAQSVKEIRIRNMKRRLNRGKTECYRQVDLGKRFVEGVVTAILTVDLSGEESYVSLQSGKLASR